MRYCSILFYQLVKNKKMENYKIGVSGKNKQGTKTFYIEVSLEPKNFPGGFR
jgi:hypothetical protein